MTSDPVDDILAHYGKKGMKWGVHSAKPSSGDIKDARTRFNRKAEDFHADTKKLKKTTERGSAARVAGMAKLEKRKVSLLKDPDRATSLRMTKGEKAATVAVAASPFVLVTPGGLVVTASAAAGAAARTIVRKNIEKKQATGAYDKKS